MRKSVSVLFAAALCVVLFGLPQVAQAEEFVYANRVALGLQGGSFLFGPTIEYWPSDNLDLSARIGAWFYYTNFGVRGTYLLDNRINILDWPARPYVGAGLGYETWSVTGWTAFSGVGVEVFAGLMQPLSKNWTVRGELQASYRALSYPYGYTGTTATPIGVDFGIFYHLGG
jgi:hypothetical protein